MSLKVYLAGPEVFLANAREQLDRKIALTRAAGLQPIAPGDLSIPPQPTQRELGHAISAIDESMMDRADAIIANLTPYHGLSADSGTCFELGYMCAQGKIAYGYTNVAADMRTRSVALYGNDVHRDASGRLRGPDGLMIEDVDMADNLMLQGGIERRGGRLIIHDAAPEARYTDTTAFEICLRLVAERGALVS
ncbi:nucleoside 2-deoxyribosyltransferase [Kaistia algarum]|uniref:nucleoside 2-deoxyribosyltransferase n=1 Tax=Kaistia algarum TaxID=2083279 RepID=UPI000CE93897|nr:nucleoside 2-deoxyribosyltransferase [Kaistia algarum]MCX5513873.1 nucleoside 2-deoxyribosyltransferase [Kaistia algarum]PPE79271.1 nucleoside 2-deoxyribosyltransferase [Kaistia algarum]